MYLKFRKTRSTIRYMVQYCSEMVHGNRLPNKTSARFKKKKWGIFFFGQSESQKLNKTEFDL